MRNNDEHLKKLQEYPATNSEYIRAKIRDLSS